MGLRVFATLRFEGFHAWPAAPDEVAFLRDRHRHLFHVRAEVTVAHQDREVEFILLKRRVEAEIQKVLAEQPTEQWSCEAWALYLWRELGLDRVEVSEDGENGAVVEGST